MGIKHLTYLDLTPEQRREGAKIVKGRLKGALSQPGLDADQRAQLVGQMKHIARWEKGQLPLAATPADPPPES